MRKVFILLLLPVYGIISAQDCTISSHSLTIEGTSSLHDWISSVNKITGKANISIADGEIKSLEKLSITLPVSSIVSEKGKTMDKKTHKALKKNQYPTISFVGYTTKLEKLSENKGKVQTYGKLSIAGTSKDVTLYGKYKLLEDGGIRITGVKSLKMSSFNIDPPVALLGTLKTGDDIKLRYNILFH